MANMLLQIGIFSVALQERKKGKTPCRANWKGRTALQQNSLASFLAQPCTYAYCANRRHHVQIHPLLTSWHCLTGNRRKEQNIVKKSVGFNWGPSAVSTTYWTGVRLCDLLKHCGAKGPLEGAKYVHFKGVPKELPQVHPFSVPFG